MKNFVLAIFSRSCQSTFFLIIGLFASYSANANEAVNSDEIGNCLTKNSLPSCDRHVSDPDGSVRLKQIIQGAAISMCNEDAVARHFGEGIIELIGLSKQIELSPIDRSRKNEILKAGGLDAIALESAPNGRNKSRRCGLSLTLSRFFIDGDVQIQKIDVERLTKLCEVAESWRDLHGGYFEWFGLCDSPNHKSKVTFAFRNRKLLNTSLVTEE
ncbi:hypothetical protein [Kinneretia aquatilis]|uniref:hypothetical protein n=1 Tax=Kinneretia aquatilis TaxID=2070761 RepID=UPI0010575672|nr:hypothetical protein [Paucibacter aquatile]